MDTQHELSPTPHMFESATEALEATLAFESSHVHWYDYQIIHYALQGHQVRVSTSGSGEFQGYVAPASGAAS
jgi:hypothetical protein